MNKSLITTMQTAGLVFSIPFELAAGPFIGYFMGLFLKNKFGISGYFIYILIVLGFVASIINTMLIIKMMLKINEKTTNKNE